MIEMIPVFDSKRVSAIGYHAETATVHVRFTDGTPWCYFDVPVHVWDDFVNAPSKGRFIHAVLNHHRHGPGG